jgi:hypothetical protein
MRTVQLLGLIAAALALGAMPAVAKDRSQKLAGADLFAEEVIPRLRIELPAAAMTRLRQQPRVYVAATVREGTVTYTNVSIRLKGGPGSFRNLDDKPAFTLNFSRLAEGQKFHGLKKLHLNNSVQDRTFLAEKVSRELFEAAGVPAPRAGHATVELNGRPLGFYVLIEGINKHFLGRFFKTPEGNVYDGHSGSEVTQTMRTNEGQNRRNQSRLRALAVAAQEPDPAVRIAALEKTLDLDRFLSFVATEVFICHWDGYAMHRNNFRIYDDVDTGRLVFLSQGTDQVFQRANTPVFPPMTGLVAKSVLEVPELRERYHDRMLQLLTNVFQVSAITNHLYAVAEKIQPVLADVDPQAGATYMRTAGAFSRRIQQRVRFLEHELLSPSQSPEFDARGLLSIREWQPQIDIGSPVLTKDSGEKPGSILLHVNGQEHCAASWRSRLVLDAGKYRFHGRLRLEGVQWDPQDPKSGAGFRISRQKFTRQWPTETPWKRRLLGQQLISSFKFRVMELRSNLFVSSEPLRGMPGLISPRFD